MADPIDMIMPMLREMRAESAVRFDGVEATLAVIDRRLGRIEGAHASYRAALSADTLMSKLITRESEERIEALEQRVRELESQA